MYFDLLRGKLLTCFQIAEGSGRALEFSRHHGAKAHQAQRSGPLTALPTLAECDDMIRRQNLVLGAMDRIREVVIAQQHALAEQRSRNEASKARQSELSDDSASFSEKQEGGGGFAGADPKKRRGVCLYSSNVATFTNVASETHLRVDATVATEQKLQSGGEVRTVLERSAMLVAYVSLSVNFALSLLFLCTDAAQIMRSLRANLVRKHPLEAPIFDRKRPVRHRDLFLLSTHSDPWLSI